MTDFPRRTMLKGALGTVGLAALPRTLQAFPSAQEIPALVVLYLNGGPAGLFNSAGSFVAKGTFGVTPDNVRSLGNGLVVDASSLGTLPDMALQHMASVNFKHGIQRHELARAALLQTGSRSNLLLLAQAMGTPARVRCAVVNALGLPVGVDTAPPVEGGVGLDRVVKLPLSDNPLEQFEHSAERAEIAAAYEVPPTATSISNLKTTFFATELLLRAGTNVVFAQPAFLGRPDRQFDTHEDASGILAREIMASIISDVRTFVGRALSMPGRNVVIALFGEFSRSVGTSDHEPGGTATVIGKYVRTGTAGPQNADGSPPLVSPPPAGLWAYLASALRVKEHPFGVNPNPELLA